MKNFSLFVIFSCITFTSLFAHSDTLDVMHYSINLNITDFENDFIEGYTTLEIKSKVNNLNTICLDLLMLEVDSIEIAGQDNPSYAYNDTLMRITPQQSFNINDEFQLTVYYHGNPVVDPSGWGGFYFSGQYAYNLGVGFEDVPHNYGRVWYPCVDDFVDRATYDFFITVLDSHRAVCGGVLENIVDNGNGTLTYHWALTDNIPTYLSSVAVGEYVQVLDTFYGINGAIPIELNVTPGDSLLAVSSFQNLKNYLQVFEDKFGAYRWQRVGYVGVPFNSGAMEHATNIAIPNFSITGNLSYEDLFSHELAHHWFGDLVTCQDAGDMWLNEGWASYSESVFRDAFYGRKNMQDYRRGMHAEVLRYAHIEDNGFLPLYNMPLDRTYSTTVYDKGDDVAHTLRCYLGDETFFDAINAYLDTYAFENASSYDFRDFLTNNTGIDLTDFFNDWVFTGGFPHYAIDSVHLMPEGSEYTVDVFVKQQLRGRDTYLSANVVPITFMAADYSDTTVYMYFSDITANEMFTINFEPKFVFCDFYEQVADATVDEYRFLKNTSTVNLAKEYIRIKATSIDESIDSIFIHITHNWAAPDPFTEDIPGLILANHRFWTIQGDFPENCSFRGEFIYSNLETSGMTGYLDNEFITNDLDSIYLMYRPNRHENWQFIEATNSTIMKRITVEYLQAGEYALAIKDWDQYISVAQNSLEQKIRIFPNPSSSIFTIYLANNNFSFANIINIYGETVDKISLTNHTETQWKINKQLPQGLYFMVFYNKSGTIVETKKILYQK